MKGKRNILKALRNFGVLESDAPSVFGSIGAQEVYDRIISPSENSENISLETMSTDELIAWADAVVEMGNYMREHDVFYGDDIFEHGFRMEKSLCNYVVRFRGVSPVRRMF